MVSFATWFVERYEVLLRVENGFHSDEGRGFPETMSVVWFRLGKCFKDAYNYG